LKANVKTLFVAFLVMLAELDVLALLNEPRRARGKFPPVVIVHVSIIDATASASRHVVTIQGNRIIRITKSGKPSFGPCPECWTPKVIPHSGFCGYACHTISAIGYPEAKKSLCLFVANGVTGIRDMGGDLDTVLEWRKQIAPVLCSGPRMIIAGPMLDGPKSRFPSSLSIDSPEEGRKAVDDLKAKALTSSRSSRSFSETPTLLWPTRRRSKGWFWPAMSGRHTGVGGGRCWQKSIEHLTGVFEGCSTAEDRFLKGPKGPLRFLQTMIRRDALR